MRNNLLKKLCILFIPLFMFFEIPINAFADECGEKSIYLTFDDGPADKVTISILDTLKKENVHATFFLIGNQIKDQEDILIRMKEEGHSLGLHSMTHEKCKLYSSNDGFLKEMLEVQNCIKEATGYTSCILRFPFGCNNNSYKLKPELIELLHKNNFKIYDWNVDSGDGANPHSSPSTLIKKSQSNKENIFLLMHCGYQSKTTAEALPGIIKYYKDQGYTFKVIDSDTPEVFHYINQKCKEKQSG